MKDRSRDAARDARDQDQHARRGSQPVDRRGANAAAAATGAGATASSSAHQVAASGSAPTSAEMVINCAGPARNSAARRHGQLGGAGICGAPAGAAAFTAGEVTAGAFGMVIAPPGGQVIIRERADQASRLT